MKLPFPHSARLLMLIAKSAGCMGLGKVEHVHINTSVGKRIVLIIKRTVDTAVLLSPHQTLELDMAAVRRTLDKRSAPPGHFVTPAPIRSHYRKLLSSDISSGIRRSTVVKECLTCHFGLKTGPET